MNSSAALQRRDLNFPMDFGTDKQMLSFGCQRSVMEPVIILIGCRGLKKMRVQLGREISC